MRQLLILSLLLSSSLWAESKVKLFISIKPAGSFEAVSEKLKGIVIKKDGVITADKLWVGIETLSTGIDLRNEHFWKYMDTKKHPRAILTEVKGKDGVATGMLEINGVKKPVTMKYVEEDGHVISKFTVKGSEFNLPKAQYLGVRVVDDIKVEAIYPLVNK